MEGMIFQERIDYLILLMGTNPLPIYVSAIAIATAKTQVILVHTKETFDFANNARKILSLTLPIENISLHEVNARDPIRIRKRIREIINPIEPDLKVVLNYTGGTKPMSAITYHEVRSRFPKSDFTYLDAGSLSLIVEQEDRVNSQKIPLNENINLPFESLIGLHGYDIQFSRKNKEPIYISACQKIAECVYKDAETWREWCDRYLRRMKPIPDGWEKEFNLLSENAAELSDAKKERIKEFLEWAGSDEFQTEGKIKRIVIPSDSIFRDIFQAIKPSHGDMTLGEIINGSEFKNAGQLAKFLDGGWLEHFCLAALNNIKEKGLIQEVLINIESREPNPHRFELDVVAMKGYQLFVLSCTTSTERGLNKSKLFEAFARSRQIGGEEARFGVVSAYPAAAELEKELRESWQSESAIRVFGPDCLPDLEGYLAAWINGESRT